MKTNKGRDHQSASHVEKSVTATLSIGRPFRHPHRDADQVGGTSQEQDVSAQGEVCRVGVAERGITENRTYAWYTGQTLTIRFGDLTHKRLSAACQTYIPSW